MYRFYNYPAERQVVTILNSKMSKNSNAKRVISASTATHETLRSRSGPDTDASAGDTKTAGTGQKEARVSESDTLKILASSNADSEIIYSAVEQGEAVSVHSEKTKDAGSPTSSTVPEN